MKRKDRIYAIVIFIVTAGIVGLILVHSSYKRNPWGIMMVGKNIDSAKQLGAAYYRPIAIPLDDWSGTCAECDKAQSLGMKILPVILANKNRTAANNIPAYKSKLNQFLQRYPTELIAVGNEENADMFYGGTPEEYHQELRAACEVAHANKIKCMDGGLTSSLVARLVADRYRQQGRNDKAEGYLKRALEPTRGQLNPFHILDTAKVKEQLIVGKALLAGFKDDGSDYVNFHWYIADAQALEEAVSFLYTSTGLPVVSNEIGQQRNEDPFRVTQIMEAVDTLGLDYAVWFSFDMNGREQARGLANEDGSLRPNGKAFQSFINSHY